MTCTHAKTRLRISSFLSFNNCIHQPGSVPLHRSVMFRRSVRSKFTDLFDRGRLKVTARCPYDSAELSHSFQVLNPGRNTPKSAQNRLESLCAGLWVPCRIFWAWFGPALGPNPARNRRFSAGSLKVFGALWLSRV